MTEPIRPRKLSDEVQDRLLERIRSGMAPGDVLPSERELMAEYEIGRPAIREAMQNLQRMGLIDIRHGGRPRVAEPSLDGLIGQMATSMHHVLTHGASTMDHLKEARVTLEAEMARLAAMRRTDGDLATLEQILDRQTEARDTPERFLDLDGEFHRTIAAISGNPIFETLSAATFSWLRSFHKDLVRSPGLEALTLKEHRAILAAIAAQDAETAARAMADHLTRANALYHQSHG
ncbi:transcriptional regulator NanR [Pseudoprimorskyibacter insulae]|nr:transcriptional regulator NanR [Pseudoprimorskyibacter insulae]